VDRAASVSLRSVTPVRSSGVLRGAISGLVPYLFHLTSIRRIRPPDLKS
jgi:hypothetical protein